MNRRNPFTVAERIRRTVKTILFWTFIVALVVCAFAPAVVYSAREWGWWALLLIPGVPIAFCAFCALIALGYAVVGVVRGAWRAARDRWDVKHGSYS